jgi:hypothetical protein
VETDLRFVSEKEHLQGIVRVCKHGQELENILDSSNKPKLLRVAEPGTELLFRSTVKGAQRQQARVRKKKKKPTVAVAGSMERKAGSVIPPTHPTCSPSKRLLQLRVGGPAIRWNGPTAREDSAGKLLCVQ